MKLLSSKEAEAIAGTLSNPSKMPGRATSTPAQYCQTGAKLQNVPGSVCHGCYAMKGFYVMPNVRPALEKRFTSVMDARDNPEPWITAMTTLIQRQEWFRWHDSGDIQGIWHLANIAEVCRRTPNTHHWLPTREYRMVKDYLANGGTIPDNLVVRLSAHMVNGPAPEMGLPTSTVITNESATCPARNQNNECRDCRNCWSANVKNVSYHKH
jgi:hypothetical protein